MDLQPHDRQAEEGLSCSLLRIVQDDRKIEQLREELEQLQPPLSQPARRHEDEPLPDEAGGPRSLPPWWAEIEQNYGGIEQLLDQLQAIYRPMPLTLVRAPFRSLVRDREPSWRDWFTSGQGTLEIVPPAEESAGELDPMCLRMGCDAFLRWRASMLLPGQSARLSWRTAEGRLDACWQERRAEPRPAEDSGRDPSGERATPSAAHQMLALPLLARVVTAHRGSIQWTRSPDFQVVFGWPLEQPAPCAMAVP